MRKTGNFSSNIGDFQHLPRFRSIREAFWMQIFVFLQPMCRQEWSVFSDYRTFLSQGGSTKQNTRKNMKFWPLNPYYKRSDWKTWLAERFSEALTSKLWNKKNTCCRSLQKWSEIELCSPPYGFIKNIRQIHLRDSHVKFMEKNKVDNTTWAKLRGLIGQKRQNNFQ